MAGNVSKRYRHKLGRSMRFLSDPRKGDEEPLFRNVETGGPAVMAHLGGGRTEHGWIDFSGTLFRDMEDGRRVAYRTTETSGGMRIVDVWGYVASKPYNHEDDGASIDLDSVPKSEMSRMKALFSDMEGFAVYRSLAA